MEELLSIIAKGLVDDPDAVSIDKDAPAEDGTVTYHIHVAEQPFFPFDFHWKITCIRS